MKDHKPGSFVIVNDFIDFTRNRACTFYEEETVHLDMTYPYCDELIKAIEKSCQDLDIEYTEGIYVCTEGPRFETRAEVSMLKQFGDVVGMTGVPEVILAKELNLCYASICTVTNYASGIGEHKLTVDEVLEYLDKSKHELYNILIQTLSHLPEERHCNCKMSMDGAHI